MPKKGHIRRVFPGGNTCKGFFSFYDYILSQDEAKRIIVIKGGPGVGKSSFMKKIAEGMIEQGYDIEYMHCSSDNGSVDGIVIPALKVALVDGTAPHIVDPKNPGCVDEIIHLGDYWNEEKMVKNKSEILKTNREIGESFKRAYRYLNASKSIYDDIEYFYNTATDYSKINTAANEIINKIFTEIYRDNKLGKERHLFASAITPDGLVNYIDTIYNKVKNIYIIKGDCKTAKSKILSKIADYTVEYGLDCEIYHCALDPGTIEHILIPKLNTILITSNKYHNFDNIDRSQTIDTNQYLNYSELSHNIVELNHGIEEFEGLLNHAVSILNYAKKMHDTLETYYIPSMDFNQVNNLMEKTKERIFNYANT